MKVIENKHKIYFHKGDSVKIKDDESGVVMKVATVVWKTNNDGSLIYENGKKIIEGILVEWLDEFGVPKTRIVDSRSIYKVEYTGQYHLVEAKKFFVKQGLTDIVESINKVLDKCI